MATTGLRGLSTHQLSTINRIVTGSTTPSGISEMRSDLELRPMVPAVVLGVGDTQGTGDIIGDRCSGRVNAMSGAEWNGPAAVIMRKILECITRCRTQTVLERKKIHCPAQRPQLRDAAVGRRIERDRNELPFPT